MFIPREKKMSYTREDVDRFKQEMIADAQRLGIKPVIEMEEDDLYKCVGLENCLSLNVARRVTTNKRRHRDLTSMDRIVTPSNISPS